jgi:hypothetical protein
MIRILGITGFKRNNGRIMIGHLVPLSRGKDTATLSKSLMQQTLLPKPASNKQYECRYDGQFCRKLKESMF